MTTSIRQEESPDFEHVRTVITAAFEASDYGHSGEADLVERLRESGAATVSLVATQDASVVGHVLLSEVTTDPGITESTGAGLAPLSVVPSAQRRGIGSALVRAAIEEARQRGFGFLVVLGDPAYYGRFGFRPALEWSMVHGFDGIPQEPFQVLFLDEAASAVGRTIGRICVRYSKEFGTQFAGAGS